MTRLGRVASTEPAASGPRATCPSPPTNRASVSGRVSWSGSRSSTSAKKNSFQEEMKANIAVATMPGRSSGSTMLTRIRSRPAPSTAAASSRSRGSADT